MSKEEMTNNEKIFIDFRKINEYDFDAIKALHEEFFPVRYSDKFYRDVCRGVGLSRGELFSSIATVNGRMVGFILAQLLKYPSQSEDKDLFSYENNPSSVCYILTLGIKEEYRRSGAGTNLIMHSINYAIAQKNCGAVTLHVIHDNEKAIRFYNKNNFLRLRTLEGFYHINNIYHTAYLYILYLNGNRAPAEVDLWSAVSGVIDQGLNYVSHMLAAMTPRSLRISPDITGLPPSSLNTASNDTTSTVRKNTATTVNSTQSEEREEEDIIETDEREEVPSNTLQDNKTDVGKDNILDWEGLTSLSNNNINSNNSNVNIGINMVYDPSDTINTFDKTIIESGQLQ